MSGFAQKAQRLAEICQRQGLKSAAVQALAKLGAIDRFVIMQRDLRQAWPESHCTIGFQLRRLDDEILRTFRDMPYPFSRHYQYRFEYGQRNCYSAMIGDTIGALMWPLFKADNRLVVSRWRDLMLDEARVSSIWADPRYRGIGLMASCLQKFATYLRQHGFRYLYACTWIHNTASIKLHDKLGFRVVGTATRYSLRWQKEGRGLYLRQRIPRDPLLPSHPPESFDLPGIIE